MFRVTLGYVSPGSLSPGRGTICGAVTSDPVVALTFDDGPDPANTPVVLDVLAQHGAHATFFLISELARRNPSLVEQISSAGHEVALHGRRHVDLTSVAPWTAFATVRAGLRELARVPTMAAHPIRFFRPPYGTQSPWTHAAARWCGLEVVGWTASPRDFLVLEPDRHVAITFDDLEPGGVVLMHDGPPANPTRRVAVLQAILGAVAERGWRATTVGDLLDGRTARRRRWLFRRAAAVVEEMRPLLVREDLTPLPPRTP